MPPDRTLKHIFSIDDFQQTDIEAILNDAAMLEASPHLLPKMQNKLVGLCFFQESTRTRIGFEAACKRLGGDTLNLDGVKGIYRAPVNESVEDTIRVVSGFCDLIIIRHPDTQVLKQAISAAIVPTINAGSGFDHLPVQALIDLYHIQKKFGRIWGLRIGIVGDLLTSRSAKSLIRALRHWPPTELRLMAPAGRQIPESYLADIDQTTITTHEKLVPEGLEILYVAGLPNPEGLPPFSRETRQNLNVCSRHLDTMPDHGIVMCPLPRIDEIALEVDKSPKANFFQQSDGGIWVRMALFNWMLNE